MIDNLQWTIYLTAFALCLQSLEYLSLTNNYFFSKIPSILLKLRLLLSLSLFFHFNIGTVLGLIFIQYYVYRKCKGPINGGSDSMTQVLLFGLLLCFVNPQLGLLYIGVQSALSYFVAGISKLCSKNWRSGAALEEFLNHSIYKHELIIFKNKYLKLCSWALIVFEISIGVLIFTPKGLMAFLIMAFIFHVFNQWYFGLHRFVWAWLASYPGLLYLSQFV